MKIKRSWTVLLIVSMLIGVFPARPVVASPQAVAYNRAAPEIAILNAYTGSSNKFYERLISDNSSYNAIDLFGKESSAIVSDETLIWPDFHESVINRLSFTRDNLKANFSGTFHNYFHQHKTGVFTYKNLVSFSIVELVMKGDYVQRWYGLMKNTETNPRLGNGHFNTVNDNNYEEYPQSKYEFMKNAELKFIQSGVIYDDKVCTCKGHYVTNMVVAFKDDRAPRVADVMLRRNNDDTVMRKGTFAAGDTIKIEVLYDEFIRFADDSDLHSDLYIRLKIAGVTSNHYPEAKLIGLDKKSLHFEYVVPEQEGEDRVQTITGVDLSPLMGEDLPLKQVSGDHNFDLSSLPSDVGGKTLGFSTTTAYITDLAGNAITEKDVVCGGSIDTTKLKIEEFNVSFVPNNQDVKDALGKTDPTDKDYLDKSDSYMGVGDKILVSLTTNKKLEGTPMVSWGYRGLEAYTNWRNADDSAFSITSQWIAPLASGSEEVTRIGFYDVTISPGMYCDDGPDAPLRITRIEFIDGYEPFKDLAGNAYTQLDLEGLEIPMQDCYIDTGLPEITSTAPSSGEGENQVYAVVPITDDARAGTFRFPFQVADSSSGIESLKGSFCWRSEGDPEPFEYIVKATPSLDGNEVWQDGYTGIFHEFTQVGKEQYVVIRPVEDHKYDVCDTEILFAAKDYAGNGHLWRTGNYTGADEEFERLPVRFKLDVVWDDVPPTATVSDVKRTVNEASGGWILDVEILLQDHMALDKASVCYAWLDQEPSIPLSDDTTSDWTQAILHDSGDERSGIATATEEVDTGTHFEKYLVVKAKDLNGNQSFTYLGKYDYDLTEVSYVLEYSSGITSKASILALSIGDGDNGGGLVFMIPIPDTADQYFVSFSLFENNVLAKLVPPFPSEWGRDAREALDIGGMIFGDFNEDVNGVDWRQMEVHQTNEGYEFRPLLVDRDIDDDIDYDITEEMEDQRDFYLRTIIEDDPEHASTSTFIGNLPVTVIAGQKGAFTTENEGASSVLLPVSATGVTSETIMLRVSSSKAGAIPEHSFTGISIGTGTAIDTRYDPGFWEKGNVPMLSSAQEVEFQVNLGVDVNGWNFEDVDYAKSYVELEYRGLTGHESPGESYKAYLSASPVQTVVFPNGNYPTGYYDVGLFVDCKAGIDHTAALGTRMYIDNTPAVQEFGIDSLTYEEKNYQDKSPWHRVDGTTNHSLSEDVLYLPVNSSGGADKNASIENIMKIAIDETQVPQTYAVRAWNATAGVAAEDAAYSITKDKDNDRFFMFTLWDDSAGAASEKGTSASGTKSYTNIGLVRNQPNTVGVQVLNANGLESIVRYFVIHPVDEAVKGTVTATRGENGSNVVSSGNLIFTPAAGQIMDGTRVYVSVGYYEAGEIKEKAGHIGQEMLLQADGTYVYSLLSGKEGSGHYVYSVYAIDSHENLTLFEDASTVLVDLEAPLITALSSSSTADGLYEAKFMVEDETLYAVSFEGAGSWSRLYLPMTISLRFNKDHAEWLGIPETMSLDLTLNETEDEFVFLATEGSPTGIYEVRAQRKRDAGPDNWDTPHWLLVTVKGVVGYRADGTPLEDFQLIMDATDALGNKTRVLESDDTGNPYGFATIADPAHLKPEAITSGVGAPEYIDVGPYDKALKLTFSSMVLPEASWICREPHYGTVQIDAFPITDDGTWTIIYQDIFGNTYQQVLTLADVFGEYGLDLTMNPKELTEEQVDLWVRTVEGNSEGTILIFRKAEGGGMETIEGDSDDWDIPLPEKNLKIVENQTLAVMHYHGEYADETHGDKLEVTIENIAKGAPEAEPRFYFEANGTEYSLETLPESDETPGNVLVWYKTSRSVTPTEGTGSSHTFKFGGDMSYTFTYEDEFRNQGSLTVDLELLGITLTEPGEPVRDTNPPQVTVALNAKRFGTYKAEESFGHYSSSALIKDVFETVSYVQGYLLVVDVYDQSEYKIVILENEPVSLTYADAVSDEIQGVTLAGNTIIMTRAEDFTIAVVDNAQEKTGVPEDNVTFISLKADDMAAWFDTTSPVARVQGEWVTLYEKNLYVELTDEANNGDFTPLVTLDSPKLDKVAGGTYAGWYKRAFTTNGSEYLVFYDSAGNMGTKSIAVDDIDETKPELTVAWYPHYVDQSDPPRPDPSRPPTGPLNTNLTAVITCNTSIRSVTAEYSNDDGENWIAGPVATASYEQTANQILVTFAGTEYRIRLTVTAPNGKTTIETLALGAGVIDKSKLTIVESVAYKFRTDKDGNPYSVPYAAEITFTPNKQAYCPSAGPRNALYDAGTPLVVTTYSNETKTYKFVDKAGNQSEVSVTTAGIDNTPPTLTVDPVNTFNLEITSASVEVEITSTEDGTAECQKVAYDLSAGTPLPISFDKNGVYVITACDKAGNSTTVSVAVGNIDKTAPMISFDKVTLTIRQGSAVDDLKRLLDEGVHVWDNDAPKDAPPLVFTYQEAGVDLSIPGLYPVTYEATDVAGNVGEAIRYVKVLDKDLPLIVIDGDKFLEPEGTMVLSLGTHTLNVEGLVEIAPGVMEPYTLKIRRGIVTEGQMKYYSSTVSVAPDGAFTMSQEGFYTVHITTQSRQSYRTLLYVER